MDEKDNEQEDGESEHSLSESKTNLDKQGNGIPYAYPVGHSEMKTEDSQDTQLTGTEDEDLSSAIPDDAESLTEADGDESQTEEGHSNDEDLVSKALVKDGISEVKYSTQINYELIKKAEMEYLQKEYADNIKDFTKIKQEFDADTGNDSDSQTQPEGMLLPLQLPVQSPLPVMDEVLKLDSKHKSQCVCEICGKVFGKPYLMRNHKWAKHEKQKLNLSERTCDECGKVFSTPGNLRIHKTAEQKHKNLKDEAMGQRSGLHMSVQNVDKPYQCAVCGVCFVNEEVLVTHTRRYHGTEPGTSEDYDDTPSVENTEENQSFDVEINRKGDDSSDNKQDVKNVLEIIPSSSHEVASDKQYACEVCGKTFPKPYRLREHKWDVHDKKKFTQKERTCDVCGKTFSTFYNLKLHRDAHERQKRRKLERVDNTDWKRYQLIARKAKTVCKVDDIEVSNELVEKEEPAETDSNEVENDASEDSLDKLPKPRPRHACEMCGRLFSKPYLLKNHVWSIHEKVKYNVEDRTCKECGKVFATTNHLSTHMRGHKGEKEKKQKEAAEEAEEEEQASQEDNEEKVYNCNQCGDRFVTRRGLRLHKKRSHKPEPSGETECKICNITFPTVSKLRTHNFHTHSDIKELKHVCPVCGRKCQNASYLKLHMRKHIKMYECDICHKKLYSSHSLQSHKMAKHFNERPHKCTVCQKTYTTKTILNQHMKLHFREKKLQCATCGKKYAYPSLLRYHEQMHREDVTLLCELCGKGFKFESALAYHMKQHSDDKPFECPQCGKRFVTKGELKGHMRSHSDEKNYVCNICGKAYKARAGLSSHMLLHSGQKPHQCEECGKSFSQKSSLTRHIRIHTGERPAVCPVCGDSFSQSGILDRHMRKHGGKPGKTPNTEEKPTCVCHVCNKSFTQSGLERHMKKHMDATGELAVVPPAPRPPAPRPPAPRPPLPKQSPVPPPLPKPNPPVTHTMMSSPPENNLHQQHPAEQHQWNSYPQPYYSYAGHQPNLWYQY